MTTIIKKGISLLLRQQTNILSAAFIIMSTVVLSQVLGLIRQRLLVSIFGASDTLGIYYYSSKLPDYVFQLVIAAALSSAFIPVFSNLLSKDKEKEANQLASTLLTLGLMAFSLLAVLLFIFAPFFLQIFNLGNNFTTEQMTLMVQLMRIILFGQLLFIVGTFFTALLQSHNHFFIPGIAAATYNLGIIIGVIFFSDNYGIYAAPLGVILGSLIFILLQIPMVKKIGFSFTPSFSLTLHVKKVFQLMWPRTISIFIMYLGTILIASLTSALNGI